MTKLVLMAMVILLLNGCTNTKIVYIEPKVYPFKVIPAPESKEFPIRNDYVEAYKAWKAEMYNTINVLNLQIETYIKLNSSKSK